MEYRIPRIRLMAVSCSMQGWTRKKMSSPTEDSIDKVTDSVSKLFH